MIRKIRYFQVPEPLIDEQQQNPVVSDLYLCETGELVIPAGEKWEFPATCTFHLLIYCTKGKARIFISGERTTLPGDHFCVVPELSEFQLCADQTGDCHLLVAGFRGAKTNLLSKNFSVVRQLLPSVSNLVANRAMLFDELFNNLSRGFHNENLEYIHFCFGHLLATFLYAHKTGNEADNEASLMVKRVTGFLEQNLDKKLTLKQLSQVAGYSPTYFATLFSNLTGYPPLSYFSHLKILKACEFLDYTSLKIKEISFRLGYSDPYYFTRDFNKRMGLSPRQYRNRVTTKLSSR